MWNTVFNSNDAFEAQFAIRFLMNLIVACFVILKVYQPSRKEEAYTFTYLIFSPVVLVIVALFSQTDLGLGFAFGLFAIFSILRYRTTTIPVKEMTYMFAVIAIAVVNAIWDLSQGIVGLVIINVLLAGLIWVIERYFYKPGVDTQTILYEKIENIHPDKHHLLKQDLFDRAGVEVIKFDVLECDYVRDTVTLRVYFKS